VVVHYFNPPIRSDYFFLDVKKYGVKYLFIPSILLGCALHSAAQAVAKDDKREITVFSFQSEIFQRVEQVFLDTIKIKSNCDTINIAEVNVDKDSVGNFHFNFSPHHGHVYYLVSIGNDTLSYYCFKVGNSGITYLFSKKDLALLGEIGSLQSLGKIFFSSLTNIGNECLDSSEPCGIYMSMHIEYSPEQGARTEYLSYISTGDCGFFREVRYPKLHRFFSKIHSYLYRLYLQLYP
jgi:hypothetical protein